ncbi:hypothetical protein ACFX12_020033 [Malus domestica]
MQELILMRWESLTTTKQTNTADMLDEAVEYVKFLQSQIQVIEGKMHTKKFETWQELSEDQRRCKCIAKE